MSLSGLPVMAGPPKEILTILIVTIPTGRQGAPTIPAKKYYLLSIIYISISIHKFIYLTMVCAPAIHSCMSINLNRST